MSPSVGRVWWVGRSCRRSVIISYSGRKLHFHAPIVAIFYSYYLPLLVFEIFALRRLFSVRRLLAAAAVAVVVVLLFTDWLKLIWFMWICDCWIFPKKHIFRSGCTSIIDLFPGKVSSTSFLSNQPINQSAYQPTNQRNNQLINQSIKSINISN